MNTASKRLRIVVPVFNDWESFNILLRELDAVAPALPYEVAVSAVDDGSIQSIDGVLTSLQSLQTVTRVDIVRLATNVGHQRAIACGICLVCDEGDADAVLVMDSDGEDPPQAIPELVSAAARSADFCVVAARRKRSENWTFRTSYIIYKSLFKAVTGKRIGHGNFSLLSAGYAARLVMLPDLWNNLAAALLRSRLPIQQVFIDRGKRYAGNSTMNFNSLIVHGFSAISVYADTIFVRLLIATLVGAALTVVASTTVIGLRLFAPSHATPGWATTVTFSLIIIVLQALFTTLTSILSLLNNRVQKLVLPKLDYKPYIRAVETVFSRDRAE